MQFIDYAKLVPKNIRNVNICLCVAQFKLINYMYDFYKTWCKHVPLRAIQRLILYVLMTNNINIEDM
jgi:hypothetical protein